MLVPEVRNPARGGRWWGPTDGQGQDQRCADHQGAEDHPRPRSLDQWSQASNASVHTVHLRIFTDSPTVLALGICSQATEGGRWVCVRKTPRVNLSASGSGRTPPPNDGNAVHKRSCSERGQWTKPTRSRSRGRSSPPVQSPSPMENSPRSARLTRERCSSATRRIQKRRLRRIPDTTELLGNNVITPERYVHVVTSQIRDLSRP